MTPPAAEASTAGGASAARQLEPHDVASRLDTDDGLPRSWINEKERTSRASLPTTVTDPEALTATAGGATSAPTTGAKGRHSTRPVPHDPLIGTTVAGGYVIRERIGSGGMGDVYRCEHPILRRSAAVKVMQDRDKRSSDVAARFQNEARAIAMLSHPNIVDVLDSGVLEDGSPYIVMEFLHGASLSAHLRSGKVGEAEALDVAVQLCAGVDRAHREGIIHRDLKPGNVFLADQGERRVLKILDFGIAKLNPLSHDSEHKTKTHAVMGTPQYMSPEQARRSAEVTTASDVYSIGLILYQMLAGHQPYNIASAGELVFYVMSRRGPVADLGEVPKQWRATLGRCLAVEPEDRFASAGELLVDIIAHVDGAASSIQRLLPTDAEDLLKRSGIHRNRQRVRARIRLASWAAAAALAMGGAAWGLQHLGVGGGQTPNDESEVQVAEEGPVAPSADRTAGPGSPAAPPPRATSQSPPPSMEVPQAASQQAGPASSAPQGSEVLFVSRPDGAWLRIVELDRRFRTPERIELDEGTYRVVATKDGYATAARKLEVDSSTQRFSVVLRRESRRNPERASAPSSAREDQPSSPAARHPSSARAGADGPRAPAPSRDEAPSAPEVLDPDDLFRTRN